MQYCTVSSINNSCRHSIRQTNKVPLSWKVLYRFFRVDRLTAAEAALLAQYCTCMVDGPNADHRVANEFWGLCHDGPNLDQREIDVSDKWYI